MGPTERNGHDTERDELVGLADDAIAGAIDPEDVRRLGQLAANAWRKLVLLSRNLESLSAIHEPSGRHESVEDPDDRRFEQNGQELKCRLCHAQLNLIELSQGWGGKHERRCPLATAADGPDEVAAHAAILAAARRLRQAGMSTPAMLVWLTSPAAGFNGATPVDAAFDDPTRLHDAFLHWPSVDEHGDDTDADAVGDQHGDDTDADADGDQHGSAARTSVDVKSAGTRDRSQDGDVGGIGEPMTDTELDALRERVETSMALQRAEYGDDPAGWPRATVRDTTVLRLLLLVWNLELEVAELRTWHDRRATAAVGVDAPVWGLRQAALDMLERPTSANADRLRQTLERVPWDEPLPPPAAPLR